MKTYIIICGTEWNIEVIAANSELCLSDFKKLVARSVIQDSVLSIKEIETQIESIHYLYSDKAKGMKKQALKVVEDLNSKIGIGSLHFFEFRNYTKYSSAIYFMDRLLWEEEKDNRCSERLNDDKESLRGYILNEAKEIVKTITP